MKHIFDVKIAEEIGVYKAIILENFNYWLLKNKANEKNNFDGNYWTFNSLKAYNTLFPYIPKSTISDNLNGLVKKGFLMKGNYNKLAFDRTAWYAFTEKSKRLFDWDKQKVEREKPQPSKIENKDTNIIAQPEKKIKDKNNVVEVFFKEVWKLYPKKTNIAQAKTTANMKQIYRNFNGNIEEAINCIEKYKKYVIGSRTETFIMSYQTGGRFFTSTYKDYIEVEEVKETNKETNEINNTNKEIVDNVYNPSKLKENKEIDF